MLNLILAASIKVSSILSSKYGRFWLQKIDRQKVSKTGFHNPMDDLMVTALFFKVYGMHTISVTYRVRDLSPERYISKETLKSQMDGDLLKQSIFKHETNVKQLVVKLY